MRALSSFCFSFVYQIQHLNLNMTNFAVVSIVLVSCILLWLPSSVAGDTCNQWSASNTTCFNNGNCNCAYLTCDGVTQCVAANVTSGVPLNLERCNNFNFCWACSNGWSFSSFCASGEKNLGLSGAEIGMIVGGVLVLAVAIGLVVFFVIRRRRSGFTSV